MLNHFLSGAIMMACWLASLFFLRFWRTTHDRFFAIFAASFLVLGMERIVLALVHPDHEVRPYVYGVRLCAFILIIIAIIDKNRARNVE